MSSMHEVKEEQVAVSDIAASNSQGPKEKESSTAGSSINSANTKEVSINQDSIISLDYLKMGANSSSVEIKNEESSINSNERNLRVELYRPILPEIEVVIKEPTYELLPPQTHRVSIEEPKVELLPPAVHVAVVEEPKIELISPCGHCVVVEKPKVGILKTSDGDEIIILSDDEEEGNRVNHDNYESAGDIDEGNQNNYGPVATRRCTRPVHERETQTPKNRAPKHPRSRVGLTVGTSSNYDSSEQQAPQKLKVNTQPQNTLKQRQLELHRHRIFVEHKRLELLELKLARERDEIIRDTILFEKELELKTAQIHKLNEDRVDV